jgi:Glyoxalase/Bleomycin resistance protein/Dioxygenase superfamily
VSVAGLHHVALRTTALDEAIENFGRIGLPVVESRDHPVLGARAAILGVGHHRVVLVEDDGPSFAYLALRYSGDGDRPAGGSRRDGLFGAGEWLRLDVAGSAVELLAGQPEERVVGDTGLWRIESIPWSVSDRAAAADEATRVLGLTRSEEHSELVFPDLHSTNSLMPLGEDCYIDFNQPTDESSPTARRLASQGNGFFALVLEPEDFDRAVAKLAEREVPTVTAEPVELRVIWRDGTPGIAARIISLDRKFTAGARIFVSEPTFPW